MDSVYYDLKRIDEIIAQEGHRDIIGGRWEQLGNLQLTFMKKAGLQPHHKLLDVGCGSLRAGVKFVQYLNPGNYFGIDISEGLLNVGYHIELTKSGLTHRLPKENLVCAVDFESGAPEGFFDFVIAHSLCIHPAWAAVGRRRYSGGGSDGGVVGFPVPG
jgi:SAM-dependent methyltransferase